MKPTDLIRAATARLTEAGFPSPSADARVLLAYVLGIEPKRLISVESVRQDDADLYDSVVESRLSGTPVQHIMGIAYFRTGEVEVGPGVFIPRPETEALAGWAIDWLRSTASSRPPTTPPCVVELCAGTGAISVAIAQEQPGARQWAVEMSADAYPYLCKNTADTPIIPVWADMGEALHELDGTVDLVVANPPYIPVAGKAILPSDVEADPDLALFSGPDGLDATRTVAQVARRLLKPGGVLGSEHGDGQEAAVAAIFRQTGLIHVESHKDLTGRPRFVTAARAQSPEIPVSTTPRNLTPAGQDVE
ncbi:MAG: peptide chain release factor N(5)-glutamine methyltransferase [Propionibacteriaceae bacterium]|jgi:release factor glutamine methyltransferase|nr:peptide chain release factor N(5)-glutamine methyltransferase [Propionibacteriaceae bacterium]